MQLQVGLWTRILTNSIYSYCNIMMLAEGETDGCYLVTPLKWFAWDRDEIWHITSSRRRGGVELVASDTIVEAVSAFCFDDNDSAVVHLIYSSCLVYYMILHKFHQENMWHRCIMTQGDSDVWSNTANQLEQSALCVLFVDDAAQWSKHSTRWWSRNPMCWGLYMQTSQSGATEVK